MSKTPSNNGRKSSRFPIVGNGDGALELPGGLRAPVRIENESAGGFGVYCNADVSVWQNEELLLLRGDDTFEVRVAHVAEIEVPRRDGEPEPDWLPLRIGLERRRLLAPRPARKRRSWLGGLLVRFDRPGHTSIALTGLFMAVAFVAAPLLWISAMQSHRNPLWTAAKRAGESVLSSVGGWFRSAKRRDEGTTPPATPWRESAEDVRRRAEAADQQLQAAAAPYRDKAQAAVDGSRQWIEATARRAAQQAVAVQDGAAQGAQRLVDAGGNAIERARQQWESGEFLDAWGGALQQWTAAGAGDPTDYGGPAAATPEDASDDALMETSNGAPDGAAPSITPPPPKPPTAGR